MLQLAFGFRDRFPGEGRQMNDPWAWKGYFCDTDYVYNVHTSTDGDLLIRQWGADGHRRNAYQTDKVPGVEPVPNAKVKISRDEAKKLTIYEMAIPRKEMIVRPRQWQVPVRLPALQQRAARQRATHVGGSRRRIRLLAKPRFLRAHVDATDRMPDIFRDRAVGCRRPKAARPVAEMAR